MSDYDAAPPARLTEEQLQRALARQRAKACCYGSCSREHAMAVHDDEAAWMFDDHLWHQEWSDEAKARRAANDHEGWLQALASTYRASGLAASPPAKTPKRKAAPRPSKPGSRKVSKSTRFEVLKRDKFACVYCGAKAPETVLHVDHINPVAKGGGNEILNLVTACDGCNLGKSDRKLDDGSAVSKARNQAAELQERREQIEMMSAWQSSLVDLEAQQVAAAHDLIKKLSGNRVVLSETGVAAMAKTIRTHGLEAVLSQLRETLGEVRLSGKSDEDLQSLCVAMETVHKRLKWRQLEAKNPTEAQARYVRGILRNRLTYVDEHKALKLARGALANGAEFAAMKQMAIDARNWTEWQASVSRLSEVV